MNPAVIIPISPLNKTRIFLREMKDASPNYMIRIEIMSKQRWNLYHSPSIHAPFTKFNMAAADAIVNFQANSET